MALDDVDEFLTEADASPESDDDRVMRIVTRVWSHPWSPETSERWFSLTKRERARALYIYRVLMAKRGE
jgi:hypothetical protein